MKKNNLIRYKLDDNEIYLIEELIVDLQRTYENTTFTKFFDNVKSLTKQMPERLIQTCEKFSDGVHDKILLISGLPINDKRLCKTPVKTEYSRQTETNRESLALVLMSTVLGDVFGWATQQNGRLVHDVYPLLGHEDEQISSGSEMTITLHTEDAFHTCRADILGLMCLRNHHKTSTLFSIPDWDNINPKYIELLFEEAFYIYPDKSNLDGFNDISADTEQLSEARHNIENQNKSGIKFAPLSGKISSPMIRLDRYFMDEPTGKYKEALDSLSINLEKNSFEISLSSGDIVFINNKKVLHGRKKFKANFDGTDRWLKRVNIAKCIKKFKASHLSNNPRIII